MYRCTLCRTKANVYLFQLNPNQNLFNCGHLPGLSAALCTPKCSIYTPPSFRYGMLCAERLIPTACTFIVQGVFVSRGQVTDLAAGHAE